MASVIALPASVAARASVRRPGRRSRGYSTCATSPRVFYFCFVLLLGRFVIGLSYEPIDDWAFNLVR